MIKALRCFFCFSLIAYVVFPSSLFAAAIGEFSSVIGTVTQTRGKQVIKPVETSPIQVKDIVITKKNATAEMAFFDDSTIRLAQNSKLQINQFLFKKQSRVVSFLFYIGKMTVNVGKFIGGDNKFEVQSPTCVIGARGTAFDLVETRAAGKTKATVSCTKGALDISALSDTGTVVSTAVLEAGQMAVISGGVITVSLISATVAAGGGTAAAAGGGSGAAAASGVGLSTGAIVGASAAVAAGAGVAVAASGGGGGGGDGEKDKSDSTTLYDATGTWKWADTYEESNCSDPSGPPYDNGTMQIVQTGTTFAGTDSDGSSFTGTVSGAVYTYTVVTQEDFGTMTENVTATLTSDTEGTYTIDWVWSEGSYSCSGITQGTMTRVP